MGNGSNTVFSFSMVADSASDVSVTYYTGSTAVSVINTSLYTLFINPPAIGQIWGIGGTVTYPLSGSPIASGTSLLIQRTLPLTQTISIANQGAFSPEVIEEALDTLCMQIQQIGATVNGTTITSAEITGALGYTPMNGANNLSEIVSASAARTNLALGTMAIQNANAATVTGGTVSGVGITGSSFAGTIDNTVIGANTRAAGNFTALAANAGFGVTGGDIVLNSGAHDIDLVTTSGNTQIANVLGSLTLNGVTALVLQGSGTNASQMSGVIIGTTNPAAGTFTSLSNSGALTFTTANQGVVLKRGANGKVGTVTLTGTTVVTVTNSSIATTDIVSFSLNTVGGTVGAVPSVKTISAGTSFGVAGTVSDTSTYNYAILSSAI